LAMMVFLKLSGVPDRGSANLLFLVWLLSASAAAGFLPLCALTLDKCLSSLAGTGLDIGFVMWWTLLLPLVCVSCFVAWLVRQPLSEFGNYINKSEKTFTSSMPSLLQRMRVWL